ncbi:hypothetical protein [uncultured Roseobacter sp.]|uniref:hypothetical protein n=1 Tax=uncultured Roseobacter sp. TaxID=114847 RepID=UPI00260F90E6|nr:hypothetical protein [uncultured Roseobacter sp.]
MSLLALSLGQRQWTDPKGEIETDNSPMPFVVRRHLRKPEKISVLQQLSALQPPEKCGQIGKNNSIYAEDWQESADSIKEDLGFNALFTVSSEVGGLEIHDCEFLQLPFLQMELPICQICNRPSLGNGSQLTKAQTQRKRSYVCFANAALPKGESRLTAALDGAPRDAQLQISAVLSASFAKNSCLRFFEDGRNCRASLCNW